MEKITLFSLLPLALGVRNETLYAALCISAVFMFFIITDLHTNVDIKRRKNLRILIFIGFISFFFVTLIRRIGWMDLVILDFIMFSPVFLITFAFRERERKLKRKRNLEVEDYDVNQPVRVLKNGLIVLRKKGTDTVIFVDKNYRTAPEQPYDTVRFASTQNYTYRIPVAKNGKWGFADRRWKIAILPTFDSVSDFNGEFAKVEKNGKAGTIDIHGNLKMY